MLDCDGVALSSPHALEYRWFSAVRRDESSGALQAVAGGGASRVGREHPTQGLCHAGGLPFCLNGLG